MAVTGPAELLATWEAGLAGQNGARALLLHRAARPRDGTDTLLSVPLGERAADLFALRRALFGERMQVTIDCTDPDCGEAMEFDLDAAELGSRPQLPEGGLRVAEGDWVVRFRLPSPADLAAVASLAADGEDARRRLGARCALSALLAGRATTDEELAALPEPVLKRFAEAAEQADPAAEVTLNIACPECGAATPAELDIAAYLWTELDAWARDVLLDIHLLASAYGWSEPQILALSPLRRRYYLELCADA
ncbi:T4 family baseplate hub assembly chaperone [Streptomyces sp. NPDC054786]